MNYEDFIKCPDCGNFDSRKMTCEKCHYSGWMHRDGKPSTAYLGETDKWKKKVAKEKEQERKAAEAKKKSIFWRGGRFYGKKR